MRGVPDRLEDPVGQPGAEHVLHGGHGQEVVDPEHRLLGHDPGEEAVQFDGAVQVLAERLLEDDPAARRQARFVQPGHRGGEDGRGQRQVGGDRLVAGDDRGDAGGVGDIGPVVTRCRHDRLPGGGGKVAGVPVELGGRPPLELSAVPPLTAGGGQAETVAEVPGGV